MGSSSVRVASVLSLGSQAALLECPQIPDLEMGSLYHLEKCHHGMVACGYEGSLPLEGFKAGGPQKEQQTS